MFKTNLFNEFSVILKLNETKSELMNKHFKTYL